MKSPTTATQGLPRLGAKFGVSEPSTKRPGAIQPIGALIDRGHPHSVRRSTSFRRAEFLPAVVHEPQCFILCSLLSSSCSL